MKCFTMARKPLLNPTKEFMFSERYETFAEEVQKYFDLTPAQWESLLITWELKETILYESPLNKLKSKLNPK